jgi:hypothetical protein
MALSSGKRPGKTGLDKLLIMPYSVQGKRLLISYCRLDGEKLLQTSRAAVPQRMLLRQGDWQFMHNF